MDEASYQGSRLDKTCYYTDRGRREHGLPSPQARPPGIAHEIEGLHLTHPSHVIRASSSNTACCVAGYSRTAYCVLKISNRIEDFLRISAYCVSSTDILRDGGGGEAGCRALKMYFYGCIDALEHAGHVADGCFNGAALWHEF